MAITDTAYALLLCIATRRVAIVGSAPARPSLETSVHDVPQPHTATSSAVPRLDDSPRARSTYGRRERRASDAYLPGAVVDSASRSFATVRAHRAHDIVSARRRPDAGAARRVDALPAAPRLLPAAPTPMAPGHRLAVRTDASMPELGIAARGRQPRCDGGDAVRLHDGIRQFKQTHPRTLSIRSAPDPPTRRSDR